MSKNIKETVNEESVLKQQTPVLDGLTGAANADTHYSSGAGNNGNAEVGDGATRNNVKPDPNALSDSGSQAKDLARQVAHATTDEDSVLVRTAGFDFGRPTAGLMQLQDFFKKPVVIGTINWTTAVSTQTMNIYALWEAVTAINGKFANFNKRGYNLTISLSLAATPYHVGLCIVDWNPSTRGPASTTTNFIGVQRRHLKIQPRVGYYTLACPHYAVEPYRVGSAADVTSRGTLYFTMPTALARCDAGVPGTVVITVRAWAEDMVLTEPSFTQTSQIVRSIGDTLGKGAGILEVGRNIFSGAADFLASLGFTVNRNKSFTDITIIGGPKYASNIEGDRSLECLTLTTTNTRLPIDDGSREPDNLAISNFVGRYGVVAMIETYDTTRATGYILANIPITPLLSTTASQPIPMSYAALCFTYWLGSIKFKITILSSPMQQGAILVTYEPSNDVAPTSVNNTQAGALARSVVMDLSTSSCLEVLAGSGSNPTIGNYTQTPRSDFNVNYTPVLYTSSTAAAEYYTSGYLTISVNKPLISIGASKVIILVEACGGPDLQFYDYDPSNVAQFQYTSQEVVDLRSTSYSDIRDRISGEHVDSFRALLNRVSFTTRAITAVKTDTTAPVLYTYARFMWELTSRTRRGINPATASKSTLMHVNDVFNHVNNCFARRTGGIRYYANVSYRTTSVSPQYGAMTHHSRLTNSATACRVGTLITGAANSVAGASNNEFPSTLVNQYGFQLGGTHRQFLNVNPILSCEDTSSYISVYSGDDEYYTVELDMRDVYGIDTYIDIYRSGKPDNYFYEFVGCPTLTIYTAVGLTAGSTSTGAL